MHLLSCEAFIKYEMFPSTIYLCPLHLWLLYIILKFNLPILGRINFCSDICWKICNTLSSSHISYKIAYSHFKGLKVEIEHLQLLMEKMKMKLQKDFEIWWSEEAKKFQVWNNFVFLLFSCKYNIFNNFLKK